MTGLPRPARPHPVTGAWMPGDDVGARRFHTFDRPVALDGGATLYASNTTGRELTPADKLVVSFFDPSAHLPGF